MKIATFNINNVNRRLPNLLAWLDAGKPDIVCLQELKAANSQFPEAAIEERAIAPSGWASVPGMASRSCAAVGSPC
jgi:exonuclease III